MSALTPRPRSCFLLLRAAALSLMDAGTTFFLNAAAFTDLEAVSLLSVVSRDAGFPTGRVLEVGRSKRAMTFTGRSRRRSFALAICTSEIARRTIRTPRSPLDQPSCPWGALGSGADPLARREVKPPGIDARWRRKRRNLAREGGGLAVQEERQVGEGEELKPGCRFRQI